MKFKNINEQLNKVRNVCVCVYMYGVEGFG